MSRPMAGVGGFLLGLLIAHPKISRPLTHIFYLMLVVLAFLLGKLVG